MKDDPNQSKRRGKIDWTEIRRKQKETKTMTETTRNMVEIDKEAVGALDEILEGVGEDREAMHIEADELVCRLLADSGYVETAEKYKEACMTLFWYA